MSIMTVVVKENSSKYLQHPQHDLLYKNLLHSFFEEFLELFFPDVHEHIDFQSITPLSEEVHTDLHKGTSRRLDIVVETKLKHTDVLIIVHIEPQSSVQTDFHERMYHYFSLLYNRYRKPIVPIAVFSYEQNWNKNHYEMKLPFFHVLTFNFLTLHLRKRNWRDFIDSNNPVAAALLSQMGYTESERIEVKKEFWRMLVRMQIDPARQNLIYGFFESYLKLTDIEEEIFMTEIGKLQEADKIFELTNSYVEKGKEARMEVALGMLKKGWDIDLISEIIRLDKAELEKLRSEKSDLK